MKQMHKRAFLWASSKTKKDGFKEFLSGENGVIAQR